MTGTVLVSTDGTNRGASMAKMSAEFRSEAPLCQRISSVIAQITFEQSAIGGLFSGVRRQNYLCSEGDPIEGSTAGSIIPRQWRRESFYRAGGI